MLLVHLHHLTKFSEKTTSNCLLFVHSPVNTCPFQDQSLVLILICCDKNLRSYPSYPLLDYIGKRTLKNDFRHYPKPFSEFFFGTPDCLRTILWKVKICLNVSKHSKVTFSTFQSHSVTTQDVMSSAGSTKSTHHGLAFTTGFKTRSQPLVTTNT